MRIAVADDGALFREGLVLLLGAAGHEVVGAVSNGTELLKVVADNPLDIAILDIRMPPGDHGGITTATTIRAEHPGLGLLLLSHYSDAALLMDVLKVGTSAIGYRLKDKIADVATLSDTLHRVLAGEIVIEPELAALLVQTPKAETSALASLGPSELKVLELMAEGRSNQSIAGELFVSSKAVEKHISGIFSKLDLPNDATVHHRRVLAVLAYLGGRTPDS